MKKIKLTEPQVNEIIRLYTEELLGSPTISERLKIHKTIVLTTLRDNGVVVGPSGRRNIGGKQVANKKYRENNKEKISEYYSNWSKNKKEHLKEYHKQWRTENIDKWRKSKRDYERNRKANDPPL